MNYGYYPAGYNNPYMPMQSIPQPQQAPQQSASGFIPVQSENEARMYPIAPGTSATFIDENAPFCYTKTVGASQLDRPIFKKFRLVEEIDTAQNTQNATQAPSHDNTIDLTAYALKADMDALAARIAALEHKEDIGA